MKDVDGRDKPDKPGHDGPAMTKKTNQFRDAAKHYCVISAEG
jgi:hypothetical protein